MTSINEEPPENQWVREKSPATVRGMFTNIASSYDMLNHVFSLNIDKQWRKFLASKTLKPNSTSRILDVCGGTGDLALALHARAQKLGMSPEIISSDFTPAMMELAKAKFQSHPKIQPLVADTTCLPFGDNEFDLVTVGFGIRNVTNPLAGLKEMARVCRPGGTVAVLEFSKTRHRFINHSFQLYFSHILPAVGRLVTGTRAYSYLSKSVEAFPEGEEFCSLMSEATGSKTSATPLSLGIATVYLSRKA